MSPPVSLIKLLLLCLCLPLPVLAPSAAESPRLVQPLRVLEAGMLLVADESMRDPSFRQAVVLIVEHSRLAGTVGLIINRRTDTDLGALVPEFAEAGSAGRAVYLGGPIAGGGLVYLRRAETRPGAGQRIADPAGWQVTNGVLLGQQESELLALLNASTGDDALRVYIGYCGWGPQQLMAELQAGSWTLHRADAALVFSDAPEELWQRLQGLPFGGGLVVQAHTAGHD